MMPSSSPALPVLDPPRVSPWRLVMMLGGSGALAGLLIVLAYDFTLPTIEAHRNEVLRTAVAEVLQQPARADTVYVHAGAVSATMPAGADPRAVELVFRGFDADGKIVGYAVTVTEPGFADPLGLIFGYDPVDREVLGMLVLSSKETPGLGDKILRPDFVARFRSRLAPLVGRKESPAPEDRSGILMITGATISSRAIINGINRNVERLHPLLERDARSTGQ